MKLKKATYRHIEAEIYCYYDTLKAIADLRAEIMYSGSGELPSVVGGTGYAHSQVERRATKLADSRLLKEMERITGAIMNTFLEAKDEGKRVIWVKYGLEIMWEPDEQLRDDMRGKNRHDLQTWQMAEVLGVDESTFHRYRSGFVYGVAEKLGWW